MTGEFIMAGVSGGLAGALLAWAASEAAKLAGHSAALSIVNNMAPLTANQHEAGCTAARPADHEARIGEPEQ